MNSINLSFCHHGSFWWCSNFYHHKMLSYLLRDRKASWFWCSNSSGFVSLFLEPSFFFQFVSFCFLSCSSDGKGSRFSGMSSRGSFHFLFPLSFWNLFLCRFSLCRFSNDNLSLSRSSSSRSRKGSNCCGSVSQVNKLYNNCRNLIFSIWGRRRLLSKFHPSSLAFSSFLKNGWEAPFSPLLLFLAFLWRLGLSLFGARHQNNSSNSSIFLFLALILFLFSLTLGFQS